ncbi:MAG: restriction endonuclease [Bacteroidota bacterium]
MADRPINFEFEREYDRKFTGRETELKWLDEHLLGRHSSFSPIVIYGPTGVGKTFLLKQWFASRRISYSPLWVNLDAPTTPNVLDEIIIQLQENSKSYGYDRGITVVIDGTEIWSAKKHEEAAGKIFNYKIVSSLVFIRQKPVKIARSQELEVKPFSNSTAADLLQKMLATELDSDQIEKALLASKGYPLALSILSSLIHGDNIDKILSFGDEPIYEISKNILVPKKEIISAAKPVIISAGNNLITSLKKQPKDIYKLSSRDFEKLLADLLRDMGWDVELTKETRDGGADILAYLNTDIGRLLCLVEAKHYREDRKISVDLVRTLYGTLCDAQANSAMLVTTSSFTKDAQNFQQKHKYQLRLRDYADIVQWIIRYGSKKDKHNK